MTSSNIEQKLQAFLNSDNTNLTMEQNRLWFLYNLDNNYPANFIAQFDISGELDVSILQMCLSDTVRRYSVLGTTFTNISGKPVKVDSENIHIHVRVVDALSDNFSFESLFEHELSHIFDLEKGPLIRFNLIKYTAHHYVFMVNTSLLILDNQSVSLLVNNIFLNYLSYLDGSSDYQSFTIDDNFNALKFEKAFFKDDKTVNRNIDFWRNSLSDTTTIDFTTDFLRPDIKNHLNHSVKLDITSDKLENLKKFICKHNYQMEDVLFCLFSVLLGRYTQQSSVAVGVNYNLRTSCNAQQLLGQATNIIVKKISISEEHHFHSLMQSLQEQFNTESIYYKLPFGYLLQKLTLKRELNRSPLFQVMYDFEDFSQPIISKDTLTIKKLPNNIGKTSVDMTFNVSLTELLLSLRIDFNSSIYSDSTMQEFLKHFDTLIHSIQDLPLKPVWMLPIMNKQDESLVLAQSLQSINLLTIEDKCIHVMIEEQAERTPNLIAVKCQDISLTYQELNDRANRLAHYLSELKCQGRPVGIYLERSVNAVVAMLGVLKAGGAYVPIDPEYPKDRIHYMLKDSQLKYVITQPLLTDDLLDTDSNLVLIDSVLSNVAIPFNQINLTISPFSLAYMIYTSGSTGSPKAVMISHVGVVNDIYWRQDNWNLTSCDRILQNSSFSFDPSVWATFWPLSVGACSVITPPKYQNDAASMIKLMKNEDISLIGTVPSLISMLMENPEIQSCKSLRYVLSGGESLSPDLLKKIYLKTNARVTNIYGPTEATINATSYECHEFNGNMLIPIGKPIRNQSVYILDNHKNLLPFNVKGEIYIGGIGVAKGYYNRPTLTSERFLNDPFLQKNDARMYRTGDFGRMRSDGNIEFLGRVDHQIKLHGFRIEIMEIEENLLAHPDIQEAVILLEKNTAKEDILVAYVVVRDEKQISLKEINIFLSKKLPKYMLPNALLCLPTIPKTVNGKIDTNALSRYNKVRNSIQLKSLTESSPILDVVTTTFQEVLQLQHIDNNDDFFELGGTSMMLTRLVTKIFNHFDISVPLHQFFKIPTIAGVTDTISTYQRDGLEAIMLNKHAISLEDDAILEDSISPGNLIFSECTQPKFIFLTGATGYLGTFLLQQLLTQTNANIYCLVRCKSKAHGLERIKKSMNEYGISYEDYINRILPVVGDLGKKQFGLNDSEWFELADCVDIIYHNGALVNFAYPYSALRGPNVEGTKEALRLSCLYRLKAFHFVSTIDVLLAAHSPRPFVEDDTPIRAPSNIPGGYTGSKWVAEKLVYTAKERGIPVCIYRPGLIMGHTETGATQANDYLLVAFRGFLPMNIIPEYRRIFDVVPVDYVAKSIIAISLQKNIFGKFYHLFNHAPVSLHQFLEWTRTFGYRFEIVPFDVAREKALVVDSDNPLYTLIPLIRDADPEPHPTLDPQYIDQLQPMVECANSIQILNQLGIVCPRMTESLTHLCLSFLVKTGFFPNPELNTDNDGTIRHG
jgi:myxalamid-type nonribosomal peptide synthetase MxaA